jgi:exosome complex component RRP46
VHNDGALFSCAVNAMCLALLDAGVPMTGVVASVVCAATANAAGKGLALLLDPLLTEEAAAAATLEFSLAPSTPGADAEHDVIVMETSATGTFSSADVRGGRLLWYR